MDIKEIKSVYFVGAGGIGMSAIVSYFLSKGIFVGGYDRTPSDLTERLVAEGADIHYVEDVELIPEICRNKATTLVVYTPAIPQEHAELCWFREQGFEVQKRAQVLGTITRSGCALCVAGTHGKTTTSTMVAHLLHQSQVGCNAFLGGISKNYGTNYILSEKSEFVVIEADEFDRSFHHLTPYASVITSADPDHLDIYGTKEAYLESFRHYTSLIREGGALVIHEGLEVEPNVAEGVKIYTYSRHNGDFHAKNIRIGGGEIVFDYVSPLGSIDDICLGVPVSINIDNGIAAMALAQIAGVSDAEIKAGMASFKGVGRRFDFKIKTENKVFLSDYAHHPSEIRQCALSLRELYADRRITALFQPHLYSRTRDFYREFAESLSLFDNVILVEIYPAREEPIPGVTSALIADCLSSETGCIQCRKEDILTVIGEQAQDLEVLVSLGAGDIENYAENIASLLLEK